VKQTLDNIQKSLFQKAKKYLDSSIKKTSKWDELIKIIKNKQIALVPFCGDIKCEDWIKDKTQGASSRLIDQEKSGNKCIHCNKRSKMLVYFSKSY